MAKLDEKRVERIYEKLTGYKMERGAWDIKKRDLAQKIVYIDDACRAVLEAIAAIENAPPGTNMQDLERNLRTEFKFLDTLQDY
ncbi:hypothetical protein JQ600_35425 [Bradyrhizobium sp. AUGA SZCCT0176]|uniref:hypothetical protein n=1 Tax=Bradyrhizobium sp. AUGA SZCCT0176 TaxID=2807664 RepID=UPI001BAB19D9|nr:hypothetical protein [Bradyrhizobium sp. AUGA SZCCT0176]MBR1230188.1 hypothetical protein [Bradyrhizobium sp. AUGA SZCCT0176]